VLLPPYELGIARHRRNAQLITSTKDDFIGGSHTARFSQRHGSDRGIIRYDLHTAHQTLGSRCLCRSSNTQETSALHSGSLRHDHLLPCHVCLELMSHERMLRDKGSGRTCVDIDSLLESESRRRAFYDASPCPRCHNRPNAVWVVGPYRHVRCLGRHAVQDRTASVPRQIAARRYLGRLHLPYKRALSRQLQVGGCFLLHLPSSVCYARAMNRAYAENCNGGAGAKSQEPAKAVGGVVVSRLAVATSGVMAHRQDVRPAWPAILVEARTFASL